jgi:hypothetical protein
MNTSGKGLGIAPYAPEYNNSSTNPSMEPRRLVNSGDTSIPMQDEHSAGHATPPNPWNIS